MVVKPGNHVAHCSWCIPLLTKIEQPIVNQHIFLIRGLNITINYNYYLMELCSYICFALKRRKYLFLMPFLGHKNQSI